MKPILWTERAQDDLAAIDAYWWPIDRDIAERLLADIEAASDILADRPQIGPLIDDHVRKWSVRRTPYLLLYRDGGDRIEILRVHHGRRDRPDRT